MALCDLLRASLLLSVPVAWWWGILTMYQLYAVAFLVGSVTVLFDVAYQSYVPSLVDSDKLPTAYRGLEAANATARLAGPAIGGTLVQILSAPVALVADVFSYLFSFMFLQARKPVEEEPSATDAESRTAWSMAFAGFGYVLRSKVLRSVALFAAVGMFASAMMAAVEMIFLIRSLRQSPAAAGLMVTAGAAGALIAVAVSGRVRRYLGPDRMLRVPVMACWPLAFLLPLATPGTAWMYACGSFFMAAGGVLANIEQNTLRPLITPPELRGRVNAAMRILMWGAMPLGGVVGGALAEAFGVRTCLWVVAVMMQLAILPLLTSDMRRPYSSCTHTLDSPQAGADSRQQNLVTQEGPVPTRRGQLEGDS
jgi:Na+/melibiose symporter-like transporter